MPSLKENTPQGTATVSAALAEKILWSPPHMQPHDESPSSDASPSFVFPDEILSEARALTSYAFSHVVQTASIDAHKSSSLDDDDTQNAPHSQPIISLYYPQHGCHNIIDSMVKFLAHDQGADVVVLDSLELALQEFGAFGKEFARATDPLYNVRDDDIRDDQMIQSIFNDIVDIRRNPDASHENENAVEQPSPRIVYMRDFGSIAPSASLLIPYLLQALCTRRTARFQKDSLDREGPLQPTVLILGFSETPNTRPPELIMPYSPSPIWSRYRGETNRVSKDFSNGGTALIQILPLLDSKLFTLKNETFPASAFSSAFFLPFLTNTEELTIQRAIQVPPIKHFMSGAAAIFVFPVDSDTEEFRNIEQRMASSRSQAVRNAWMTLCLGRRGAVVCEKPLDSIVTDHIQTDEQSTNLSDIPTPIDFLDELHKRTGLLPPVSLDRIASIALGLSSPGSSAPTAAIQVTPALVSRAYQLFVQNLQARSDWTKTVMGHEERKKEGTEGEVETGSRVETEDGETEEQATDPIVQKVMWANDLNDYERKLLHCIVDRAKLETRFEDVCIPGHIIDSLRTVASLPLLHPSAFKVGVLGRETVGGVLLYGPPGTGKTLVCRALARECGVRMLQLKLSNVMDGECEKLVKAIFSLAYRLAPCVIFIDELDSLFDRHYQRNILNEFLQSMDGLQSAGKNQDCGVVIIGATNIPHALDDAILRRFATRLMVALPNEAEREQILRLHLRDEQLCEDVDLYNIASKTEYYSGSDLKALCVSAAMASVKDSFGNFSWTSHIPSGASDTPDQISGEDQSKFRTRTITLNNFEHAINEVPPSSSAGSHSELLRWHDQFSCKRTLDKQKKEQVVDPIVQKVKGANDLNNYERTLLNCIVDSAKLETRFEDVCIPGNIIDSLRTVVSLSLLHPSAFKVGVLGREAIGGVLLYGPPGTGKTLVCRALARECGVRMLQLKPSDVMDLYVGESEKLVKAIFSLAYRLAPCVIFIDELDSLFKVRSGQDDRQYERNILNEFLQSMDGLQSAEKNKDCGVVIVGATNRPHDLDNAILRRFATRLMVALPNEHEREQILRLHLRGEQLDKDVDLHNIASKTEYYSGSDLKALCVSAAMASVKDSIGNFSWTSHIPSGASDTPDQISGEDQSKFRTRTITLNNFEHAINEVPPSSSAGSHSELLRWHDQFSCKRTLDKQKKEQVADPILQKVKGANDLNNYERTLLNCIVDRAKLETRFEDVCIPGNVIDSLRTVVSLPLLHPSAFNVGVLGREAIGGVLLYGPPGTGKTLVCRALARECGVRMLQLKPSDIMDLYVGESEKLVKAIFSLAYRLAPCIIFIDELDSLFKARSGKDDRQYQRNILNEFLQSMDGLQSAGKNKDCGVVIVGATNRPHDLDDAILRRLATRLMVALPNEHEREQILRLHLRDEQLGEDVDLRNIASKTDYYSGSDLKALCVSAAMASVKDSLGNFSWTSHIPSGASDTPDQVSGEDQSKFCTRTITLNNFTHAMSEVPPSSSAGGHSELLRWHDQFSFKRTLDKRSGANPQINGHSERRTYSGNGERRYNWKQPA